VDQLYSDAEWDLRLGRDAPCSGNCPDTPRYSCRRNGKVRQRLSAGHFPPPEPPAKRLLPLTRSAASQDALHADIFIQIRPVDPLAACNETPVGALGGRPVCQARVPGEWRGDRPAIRKVTRASLLTPTICASAPLNSIPEVRMPRPQPKKPRFPRPVFRCVRFPPGQSRGFSPNGPVPAKTSPLSFPAPHSRREVRLGPPSKRGMAPREERLATYPSLHGQEADWRGPESQSGPTQGLAGHRLDGAADTVMCVGEANVYGLVASIVSIRCRGRRRQAFPRSG